MSTFTGPLISNDGLVLCYDMNNVQKSWKGKPTTNLLVNPLLFDGADWNRNADGLTMATATDPLGTNTAYKLIETSVSGYHRRGQSIASSAGSLRTFSFFAKAAERTLVRGWSWAGGDTGQQTFDLSNGTCTGSLSPTISNVGNGWYYCSFQVPAANTDTVIIGPSDGTVGTAAYTGVAGYGVYVWRPQLEVGSFATPFVNGTRSTTEALVDVTGKNTITANSLTYTSDGSFSLNGTTDYFSTSAITGIGSSSTSFTMEIWVSPASSAGNIISMSNANPQTNWNMPPISATGQTFSAKVWSNNRLYSSTYTLNTWYQLALSFDTTAGAQYFYVNGELVGSQTGITYSASNSANYLFIGQQNPGADNTGMFAGKIGNLKVYTGRALSSQEIKQNFAALRGRYGI